MNTRLASGKGFESALPSLGPSDTQVARVTLGRMIQTLRQGRRLTSRELGVALGWSQSKMSKIEGGSATISDVDLTELIGELRASERQSYQLRFQLELTRLPPLSTRSLIAHGVEKRQRQVAEYERIARTIDQYGHSVIPGMLQVPEYTRALLASFDVPERSIGPAVEERLARQRILAQTLRSFHFILTEAVLYTTPGSAQTQVEQLTLLRMQSALRHIRVGVVPTDRGTLARALTGFTIFNSHFVTTETVVIGQQFTDPTDVRTFIELHERLAERAIYDGGADELIAKAISRLEQKAQERAP